MSSAEEALFVVRLPADAKTIALGKIPELIGIALYEARFGGFDAEAADDETWQYIHLVAIDYEKALTLAAATGELEVLNDFTLRALPPALVTEKAVVSLPALRKFIATQGGSLLIETHSPARIATNAPPPVTIVGQSSGPDLSIKYELRSPDWTRWARLDIVRLWEAACLAANIEPPAGKTGAIWAEYELRSLPTEFQQIWEVVNCDETLSKLEVLPTSGRMLWQVHLPGFASWAVKKGLHIPPQMRNLAAAFADLTADTSGSTLPSPPTPSMRVSHGLPTGVQRGDSLRYELVELIGRMRREGVELTTDAVVRRIRPTVDDGGVIVGFKEGAFYYLDGPGGDPLDQNMQALKKRIDRILKAEQNRQ